MFIKTLKTTTCAIAVSAITLVALSFGSEAKITNEVIAGEDCYQSTLGDRLGCDSHEFKQKQRYQRRYLPTPPPPTRVPNDPAYADTVGEGGGGDGGGGGR